MPATPDPTTILTASTEVSFNKVSNVQTGASIMPGQNITTPSQQPAASHHHGITSTVTHQQQAFARPHSAAPPAQQSSLTHPTSLGGWQIPLGASQGVNYPFAGLLSQHRPPQRSPTPEAAGSQQAGGMSQQQPPSHSQHQASLRSHQKLHTLILHLSSYQIIYVALALR